MADKLNILSYQESHKQNVRNLFIQINRLIAPKGMFGLEQWQDDGMELRRMYVDPEARHPIAL
ncbi:MAG: hypothetical protein QMB27_02525 [Rhodospirillales bacterium]